MIGRRIEIQTQPNNDGAAGFRKNVLGVQSKRHHFFVRYGMKYLFLFHFRFLFARHKTDYNLIIYPINPMKGGNHFYQTKHGVFSRPTQKFIT